MLDRFGIAKPLQAACYFPTAPLANHLNSMQIPLISYLFGSKSKPLINSIKTTVTFARVRLPKCSML